MLLIIFTGLLTVTALHFIFIRKFGMKEGVQVVSNLVTTIATVTLGVFAWQQMQDAKRMEAIQKTANWGELRNNMWEILDQFPPSGIDALRTFSVDNKRLWMHNIRKLLDSKIKNPVLIEDKQCLGYWRNAISTTKTSFELLSIRK
ncbi:hypothetical protein L0244_37685, partial [bacterium]|nr:hypothetical protein [bacterium]